MKNSVGFCWRGFYGIFVFGFVFTSAVLAVQQCCLTQPSGRLSAAEVERRVEDILSKMTLEEKIDHIGGYKKFNIRPIERLGLPMLKMADGPVGCRNYGKATAYPATIGLAASWNRKLANTFGSSLGRDCRARGVHILLAPGVNIYRSPLCARNFEYLGEDPYLAGEMVTEIVRGVQNQGVMATVKHYIANNQEYDRHGTSSDVDERTLREIYMPAFKSAVQRGGANCVMAAYNPVGGIHCSEHAYLINTVLKEQWGFDGIVMSDWWSTYSVVEAANAGLDIEMPSGDHFNRKNLIPRIEAGDVTMATIDDKIRRILRTTIRMGFLDREQLDESIPLDDPAGAKVALDVAREAIVLLKNDGNILPIDRNKIQTVAVVGPNAKWEPSVHGGGGSSFTVPFHGVSPYDGIEAAAKGKVKILSGADEISQESLDAFEGLDFYDSQGRKTDGLEGKYYFSEQFRDKPVLTRFDKRIAFSRKNGDLKQFEGKFGIAWQGRISPVRTGFYLLVVRGGEKINIKFQGTEVIQVDNDDGRYYGKVEMLLEKGRQYDLKINYRPGDKDWSIRLGCGFVSTLADSAAVRAAEKADVAIVCVGPNPDTEREGKDRDYKMSDYQRELIRSIAAVNDKTIVVLNGGGTMESESWIGQVEALLHTWYPGQEGGTAIGEILFGDVNPSAKLPITFERRWEDSPVYNYYHDTNGQKRVKYEEGVFAGYRGYDKNNTDVLFAFGHGLSYTKFVYGDVKVSKEAGDSDIVAKASVEVTNTGKRAGAEVAQLYIHDVKSSVARPIQELKGFEKITLEPGRTKVVTFDIRKADLSFYDVKGKSWKAEPGSFEIRIGSSSRDIRSRANLEY
jgi:beta-glucosidase